MNARRQLHSVDVHAEGEQGACYLGGVFEVPGSTMADKLRYLNEVDDSLRLYLTTEPRGRPQMSANLVFPSNLDGVDAGFVILQADRAHAMSGSNTICVTTALLESGSVAMHEPITDVALETAAGVIRVKAQCANGRCERVTFTGVPSFVDALDVPLDVAGYGAVTVDVAYGGCYYLLVDAAQLGVTLDRGSARAIVEAGEAVMAAARETITVKHPTIPEIDFISYVMVVGGDPATGRLRGATVLSGRVDRSPCGTGNSARLAVLHARGLAAVGDRFVANSIIDSQFDVAIVGTTELAGHTAVIPEISGRGWVFGTRTTALDGTDPYPTGFTLTDVWGRQG
jgi:proline racemase